MKTNTNPGVIRTVLVGSNVFKNLPPVIDPAVQGVIFKSAENDMPFQIGFDRHLSRGLLLLGGTGSGKSNVYMHMLDTVLEVLRQQDLLLVFDPKGEFLEQIKKAGRGDDIVLISTDPADSKITRHWNIFEGLLLAETAQEMELQAREISRALFAEHIEKSHQPFFGIAASDIFTAALLDFLRTAKATGDYSRLNNQQLVRFFQYAALDDYHAMIDRNPDFQYLKTYIGKKGNEMSPQSLGVLGILNSVINTILVGPFGKSGRPFSMARLTRERTSPRGTIVVLKYNLRHSQILETVYSLLISDFIKQTLALGEKTDAKTYLFLDELALIPYLSNLDQAANFGRSRGIRLIAGLQSYSQLKEKYGDQALPIASGFSNCIAMRCVDEESRNYISGRFGKAFENLTYAGQNIHREAYAVGDAEQRELSVGEAIIDLCDAPAFRFRFRKHDQEEQQ